MFNLRSLNYPPNIEIDETSLKNAWARLVKGIMVKGMKVDTDYGDVSYDVCSRVMLTGNALDQVRKIEVHKQEPFGKKRIEEYLKQFERGYDFKAQGFEYTYVDRLARYGVYDPCIEYGLNDQEVLINDRIDQLAAIKKTLKSNVTRRAQAITWIPEKDNEIEHSPCLQRVWIRPFGNSYCEVHMIWRSRDVYGAWSSNVCGVMNMLWREVLDPLELQVVKLVDFCNSAHIYEYDWESALKVLLEK